MFEGNLFFIVCLVIPMGIVAVILWGIKRIAGNKIPSGISIDFRSSVYLFALALGLLVCILFSLLPGSFVHNFDISRLDNAQLTQFVFYLGVLVVAGLIVLGSVVIQVFKLKANPKIKRYLVGIGLVVSIVFIGIGVLENPNPLSLILVGILVLIMLGPGASGIILQQNEKRAMQQAQARVDQVASQKDTAGLGEFLMDHNWRVRLAAANALEQIGIPDDSVTRARWLVAKGEFYSATLLGDVSVEPLIHALNYTDTSIHEDSVRGDIAAYLAQIGDVRAVQPLLKAINGLGRGAPMFVANLLAKFKDPRAVDQLIAALENTDADVRWAAAYALGKSGDTKALSELERVAREDKGDTYDFGSVKDAAQEAIAKIRGRMQNE